MTTLRVIGAEGVCAALKADLEEQVPLALDDLERPTDDPVLPGLGPVAGSEHPALYATSDRFRIEPGEYPSLLIVPQDTPSIRYGGDDDDGPELWIIQYRLRVFSFVRAQSYEQVAAVRNRLVLAIRVAMWRHRQLAADIQIDAPGRAGIYRESYSEAARTRDNRSVAGAFQEISCSTVEGASIAALGVANTIAVDLHPFS